MNKEELKKVIDAIIDKTFTRLENVYLKHKEGFNNADLPLENESRLVFPAYYYDEKGEKKVKGTRISEQELRFAFVEEFNSYCRENNKRGNNINLFYSVETPTKDTYSGFTDNPIIDHEKGRSAEFDLVIYDEHLNRKCLIEFKANNAKKIDHDKDFLKLNNKAEGGDDVLRYFIEVIKSYSERENGKRCTISNLKEKFDTTGLKERIKSDCKIDIGNNTQIRCYALEGQNNNETISEKDISEKFKNASSNNCSDE